jgi:precorrin-2 dehydrogenase / sirohydrochlorin ferrochelatase
LSSPAQGTDAAPELDTRRGTKPKRVFVGTLRHVTSPATHAEGLTPVYLVGLVVAGRRCLVVGGGNVAARKIRGLLQCGAAVTVVAPEAHEAIRVLADEGAISQIAGPPLDVQIREYREGEAARFELVFTATGDVNVDAKVHRDAEEAGVWVNSADDTAHSSFMLPAVVRDGPVTVAVSTSGASPALATWLRDRLASHVQNGSGELARLLNGARRRMRDSRTKTDAVDWTGLLNGPLPDLVAEGKLDEAGALIEQALRRQPAVGEEDASRTPPPAGGEGRAKGPAGSPDG